MKKLLFLLLSFFVVNSVYADIIQYAYQGVSLSYDLDEETCTCCLVEQNTDISGDVKIPSSISYESKSYDVTSICHDAFRNCDDMESISIPETVKFIGKSAFAYCFGLQKAEFVSIEAFLKIKFETSFANPLMYAHHLYFSGEEVKDLAIPPTITSIADYAFYSCRSLTSIYIPSSVASIGEDAFYDCKEISKAEF